MPSLDDPKLVRAIIMEHYQFPRNKREVNDDSYDSIHMDSDSCVDDFHIYLKMNGDIVEDVAFSGVGCTISTSSNSIMTELVIGKTRAEALNIIENYLHMVYHDGEYDEDLLEEANVFSNTYKQANRIKCATIGWNGLKQLLEKEDK